MSNHASHGSLPWLIKGARYTVLVPYLDGSGVPTDPTTPDTEISKDGGAFADTTEEVTTITGSNGMGYVTLTGDETNCTLVGVAAKVASGPNNTLMRGTTVLFPTIRSGTAAGGASGSITLDGSASATDDFYNGCVVVTTGGTGGGGGSGSQNNQARIITDYNGTTKVATVEPNWETAPDNTTTFKVLMTPVAVNVIAGASGSAPTAAQVATAVWQDTTAGDFTVPGSIGKSLFTSGVAPGASGGLLISGTNSGTVVLGALTVSGATALAAVTTSGTVTMNAFTVTNATTFSGAVTASHASNDVRGMRLSAAGVDDIWDEDIVAAHSTADTAGLILSQLTKRSVTLTTAVADGSVLGQLFDDGSATYDRTTDSMQSIRDAMATTASVADAVWDESRASHIAAGSFGQMLQAVRSGTLQAGGSETVTLDASASAVDDLYNSNVIQIIDGTGAGQTNIIEDYVGSTNVATVRNEWAVTPDATSVFVIHPNHLDLADLDIAVSTRMPSSGGISTIDSISGDDLELLIGVDYKDDNGNAIEFAPVPSSWPDLTDATVTLFLQNPVSASATEVTGVVDVASGTSQAIHFDVSNSVTSGMVASYVRYWVRATLASGDYYPLAQGVLRWRDPLEA